MYSKPGWDGSTWGPLLEKAWAKVNGNYENIEAGSPSEGVKFLTNAPSFFIDLADYANPLNDTWNVINDGAL